MAEGLYGEVNKRLQKAIKDKNMAEITVVQGLVELATNKMESARKNLEKNQKRRNLMGSERR